MLQIYAPGDYGDEGDDDESFHRTVYLFVCSSKNGCTGEATVVRQQLKEKNIYYPETAPDYEVSIFICNLTFLWFEKGIGRKVQISPVIFIFSKLPKTLFSSV